MWITQLWRGCVYRPRARAGIERTHAFLSAARECAAFEFIGHRRGASGPDSRARLVSIGKSASVLECRSITNEGGAM